MINTLNYYPDTKLATAVHEHGLPCVLVLNIDGVTYAAAIKTPKDFVQAFGYEAWLHSTWLEGMCDEVCDKLTVDRLINDAKKAPHMAITVGAPYKIL